MTEYTLPSKNKKVKKAIPTACKIIYLLTLFSLGLYLAFTKSPNFSDWFNRTVSSVGRAIFSFLTVWIPFSLAEWIILSLPVLAVVLIVAAVKKFSASKVDSWRFANFLFSVLCGIFVIFVWNFAPGYYGTTLDQKLSLERKPVSADELYQTAMILVDELEQVSEELVFPGEKESSVMPYSYEEMSRKLMLAYSSYAQNHDFPVHYYSRVKPVMMSKTMSRLHITGVYSFFTGEANINVDFPDYTVPYTAAHELAHQRGVAREDEANMIAFLICMESDDPYIRYSALLSVYEYVSSALYSANPNLYYQVARQLPRNVIREEIAYSEFFKQYANTKASEISEAVNNAYLQSQGAPEGSRSYNMVVDLTVAYFRPRWN
jgi:hypothetical protein